MQLNPEYPAAYASILGQAYFFNDQAGQAIPFLREAIDRNTNLLTAHVFLIATLSLLNRLEEAAWAAEQLKNVRADFTLEQLDGMLPTGDQDTIARIEGLLRQAGL